MAYPEYLSPVEKQIVDRIIKATLGRGWLISIWDGEAWAQKKSQDYEAITADIAATDLTQLKFRDPEGKPIGSIILVHGNDEDVIGDCSDVPAILEICNIGQPE